MVVMTLDQYCRMRYGLSDGEKPTKSQRNTVAAMCREGSLMRQAFKSGRRWLINDGRF